MSYIRILLILAYEDYKTIEETRWLYNVKKKGEGDVLI